MPRRVAKVGGSLLSRADLWSRLERWLSTPPRMETVLVIGGGAVVEAIRDLDQLHGLDPVAAHWWCVQVMSMHAQLAHAKLSGSRFVSRLDEIPAEPTGDGLWILDPFTFLRHDDAPQSNALPPSWDVTSDSIAARLASRLRVDELVLLKSSLPRSGEVTSLAAGGYVDPYFPVVAAEVQSAWVVDLTADAFPRLKLSLPAG